MPQQLIYTSSKTGLEFGRSGFCTVAKTSSMKKNLTLALEGISYFDTSNKSIKEIFQYRILSVGGDTFYVCSRLADCGFDYSGRTNFIAQHIVFCAEEKDAYGNPAEFISTWNGWLDCWNTPPRELSDGEGFASSPSKKLSENNCATWGSVSGNCENARLPLIAGKAVFEGVDWRTFLRLLAESLSMQPQKAWDFSFATSLQKSESPQKYDFVLDADKSIKNNKNYIRINPNKIGDDLINLFDEEKRKSLKEKVERVKERIADLPSVHFEKDGGADTAAQSVKTQFGKIDFETPKARHSYLVWIVAGLCAIIAFLSVMLALSSVSEEESSIEIPIEKLAPVENAKVKIPEENVNKSEGETAIATSEKSTEKQTEQNEEALREKVLSDLAAAEKAQQEAKTKQMQASAAEKAMSEKLERFKFASKIFPQIKDGFGKPENIGVVVFNGNAFRYDKNVFRKVFSIEDSIFNVESGAYKTFKKDEKFKFLKAPLKVGRNDFAILCVAGSAEIPLGLGFNSVAKLPNGNFGLSAQLKNSIANILKIHPNTAFEIEFSSSEAMRKKLFQSHSKNGELNFNALKKTIAEIKKIGGDIEALQKMKEPENSSESSTVEKYFDKKVPAIDALKELSLGNQDAYLYLVVGSLLDLDNNEMKMCLNSINAVVGDSYVKKNRVDVKPAKIENNNSKGVFGLKVLYAEKLKFCKDRLPNFPFKAEKNLNSKEDFIAAFSDLRECTQLCLFKKIENYELKKETRKIDFKNIRNINSVRKACEDFQSAISTFNKTRKKREAGIVSENLEELFCELGTGESKRFSYEIIVEAAYKIDAGESASKGRGTRIAKWKESRALLKTKLDEWKSASGRPYSSAKIFSDEMTDGDIARWLFDATFNMNLKIYNK